MGGFIFFLIGATVFYFWLGTILGPIATVFATISCMNFCADERKAELEREREKQKA